MGVGSLLEMERRASVAWPLMSLTPKISDCGNETETLTFRLGVCGSSVTFSTCSRICQFADVMQGQEF